MPRLGGMYGPDVASSGWTSATSRTSRRSVRRTWSSSVHRRTRARPIRLVRGSGRRACHPTLAEFAPHPATSPVRPVPAHREQHPERVGPVGDRVPVDVQRGQRHRGRRTGHHCETPESARTGWYRTVRLTTTRQPPAQRGVDHVHHVADSQRDARDADRPPAVLALIGVIAFVVLRRHRRRPRCRVHGGPAVAQRPRRGLPVPDERHRCGGSERRHPLRAGRPVGLATHRTAGAAGSAIRPARGCRADLSVALSVVLAGVSWRWWRRSRRCWSCYWSV